MRWFILFLSIVTLGCGLARSPAFQASTSAINAWQDTADRNAWRKRQQQPQVYTGVTNGRPWSCVVTGNLISCH